MYSQHVFLHNSIPEVRLKKCVFACTNPRANRKAQVSSIIGISRIGWNTAFLPKIVRVVPLNYPTVKTRFLANNWPTSCWPADPYRPWARPTSLEVGSGPSVNGSSKILTSPNKVGNFLVIDASSTSIVVGFFPDSVSRK